MIVYYIIQSHYLSTTLWTFKLFIIWSFYKQHNCFSPSLLPRSRHPYGTEHARILVKEIPVRGNVEGAREVGIDLRPQCKPDLLKERGKEDLGGSRVSLWLCVSRKRW